MQDRDEQEKYLNRRPSGFVSSPVQRTPVRPNQGSYSADDYDATEALLNAPAQDRGFFGGAKDLGLGLAKGTVKLPGTVLAALETPVTGGSIGKRLEDTGFNFGDKARDYLDTKHTEKHKEIQAGYQALSSDDKSFAQETADKLGYALSNPSMIPDTIAQSLPDMVVGAKIGGKIGGKGKRLSPEASAGIGEGIMMMGHQSEAIREGQGGETLSAEQRGYVGLTGAAGALFSWGGNRVAKRFGVADVDTLLAKGLSPREIAANISSLPAKSVPKAVVLGAIQEGFLEELPQEASETILKNLALDKPWAEGLEDAVVMAPLAGMAMGGPVGGVGAYSSNRRRAQIDQLNADQEAEGTQPSPEEPIQPTDGAPAFEHMPPQPMQDDYRVERPSQRMGLNPDNGPLSAAAALSVDSGLNALPYLDGTLQGEYIDGSRAEPRGFIPRGFPQTIDVDAHGNPVTVDGQQVPRNIVPEKTLQYEERQGKRAPVYEVDPEGVAHPTSGEAARSRKERIDLSSLKDRQQTNTQKQPAAMPEQRSPEQQAQSIWDSMNAFERNAATTKVLGMRGVPAKNAATKAWDKLSAEQQAKLVSGLDAQQGQRWTDPNQKVTDQTGPVLQNRDRTSQDSINQMRSISNNPDYSRLKTSGFLSDGAPVVVDENIQIPASQIGVTDTASAGNERFNVQYAVVEADQLMTSNSIDGTTNTEYQTGAAGKARAIAGNGRITGLQSAWAKGNASQYKADMAADRMHGIDPAVIEGMRNPILVRLLPQEQVTDNIGDLSNRDEKNKLSPIEQAKTDMGRIDLDSLKFTAEGAIGGEAIHQFRMAQPAAERVTEAEARKRLTSAIFQKAYGNDQLTEIQSGESDDAKSILSALAQAAPSMSRLEGAGEFDIRPLITQAGIAAVNAARRGIKLADYVQQSEMGIDPMVYPILEMMLNQNGNIRSSKYIGEQLTNMAKLAYDEANSPSSDMFGEKPKRTGEQVIQDALTGVQGYGQINDGSRQESLEQQGGAEPDAQMVEGTEGGRERPADTGQVAPAEQQAEVTPWGKRSFTLNIDDEYGPPPPHTEAYEAAKSAPSGSVTHGVTIRPSGKQWHNLYLSHGDGSFSSVSIGRDMPDNLTELIEKGFSDYDNKQKKQAKALEEKNAISAKEIAIAKENNLVLGRELGTIIPNTGKQFKSAKIITDHGDGTFTLRGVQGNRQAELRELSASSIVRAMDRQNLQSGTKSEGSTPETWRSNYIQAAKIAREKGIDPKQHKELADLVAAIDDLSDKPELAQPKQTQQQLAAVEPNQPAPEKSLESSTTYQNTRSRLTAAYNGDTYKGAIEDYADLRSQLEALAQSGDSESSRMAQRVLEDVDNSISNLEAKKTAKKEGRKPAAKKPSPTINERRIAATLARPSKWKELRDGDGTVKSSVERAVREGWTFSEVSVTDTAAKKRDEEKVKQVSKRYMLGLSNPNIPEVKAGLEAKARLDAGEHKKSEYRLSGGQLDEGSYYTITKTAYDYAKSLESQETQAPDLDLTQQTEESLAKDAERLEQLQKEEAAQKAKQKAAERKQRERDADKARADEVVDNFQLGQSAEEAMSGMDDIFATESKPKDDIKSKRPAGYGKSNKLVSADRAEVLRERLRSKLRGQLNSGFDPEILAIGAELAAFHIEAGARKFTDFAKAIAQDLGMTPQALRQYLRSWYNGARDMMEDSDVSIQGMDSPSVVAQELSNLMSEEPADTSKPEPKEAQKNESKEDLEAIKDYVLNNIAKHEWRDNLIAKREVIAALNEQGYPLEEVASTLDIPLAELDSKKNIDQTIEHIFDNQQVNSTKGEENVSSAANDMEQSSDNAGSEETTDGLAGNNEGEGRGSPRSYGQDSLFDTRESGLPGSSESLFDSSTTTDSKRGDNSANSEGQQTGATPSTTRSDDNQRGGNLSDNGIPADTTATEAVSASVRTDVSSKLEQQKKAEGTATKRGDIDNIRQALPYLLEAQQDDVLKIEQRFMKPDGYGMLITNGTGTGKTFSGLGVVKRFVNEGKSNILIVTPDEKVASDWAQSGIPLNLEISQLQNTQDAGQGIVITTYANLGANSSLSTRKFDLVVADEAHKLMQGADAKVTKALAAVRALTMHPEGATRMRDMRYPEQVKELGDLENQINELKGEIAEAKENKAVAPRIAALEKKLEAVEDKYYEVGKYLRERLKEVKLEFEAGQGAKRPRLLALTATPFSYVSSIEWANGYLFDYNEGKKDDGSGAYNEGDNRSKFFIENFGYRMRYNRLTQPDANVNVSLMERQFNERLRKSGALSGRTIDVPFDYDRRFILTESKIGQRIDEALQYIQDGGKSNPELKEGYAEIRNALKEHFSHLERRYLLEAIKAKAAIPIIKEHLKLGRKVVVFHDYKKGGSNNPFAAIGYLLSPEGRAAYMDFAGNFSDLTSGTALQGLESPITVFRNELPETLIVNGDESKRNILERYKKFQSDDSGPQVMLVQSAKNAGWSGHDTTGKHQRVLINLGLPTTPSTSIQQEGRIYRVGQASNAIQRYMNTGTNWERAAFAQTIAQRSGTVENLSMGVQARALKQGFIDAFEDTEAYPPGHEGEGAGGKELDKALQSIITPYDEAKSYYYGQRKRTSRNKSQEGKDYFATPEPVGLKMVEWLALNIGDSALEPSAGHGAIGRWLPEHSRRTFIEPSNELRSRLSLLVGGQTDRILDGDFESFNIINKFDGVAMNPPFGVGGKLAAEHVGKAMKHLRDGGRIAALIPEGPAANKQFEKLLNSEEAKELGIFEIAEFSLPDVTFERAGTKVKTRIIVLEKQLSDEGKQALPQHRRIDFSNTSTIDELFDRLEEISLPQRTVVPEGGKKNKGAKAKDATTKASGESVDDSGDKLTSWDGKHTKTGETLYMVKPNEKLEREQYNEVKSLVSKHDGFWDRYTKGFRFNSSEDRQSFLDDFNEAPLFSRTTSKVSQSDIASLQKRLEQDFGLKSLFLSLNERQGSLSVDNFVVPKEGRKKGTGSLVMNEVISFADKHGLMVTLSPGLQDDMQGTTSRGRLVNFYKRFGFVENKGRSKDFTISAGMYRTPSEQMFSRNTNRSGGMTKTHAQNIANNLLGGNARQQNVHVVQNYAELPAEVKRAIGMDGTSEGDFNALHYKGKSYIVADAMGSQAEVEAAIFHEHFTHGGLRTLYGKDLANKLDDMLFKSGGIVGVRMQAKKQGIDLSAYESALANNPNISEENKKRILMEELLAHMAHTTGTLRRKLEEVLGAIRQWLRDNGFAELANLRASDIAHTLRQSRYAMASVGQASRGNIKTSSGLMFSRNTTPNSKEESQRQFAATEKAYGGRTAYDQAKSEGNTKLSYQQWVQVRTPAFKEWFGDWENDPTNASKVVDSETGEPMVVYHGTPNNDFNVFEKNSSSKWMFRVENREMFFFSTSKKVAEFYADGGRVVEAYLKLENPVSLDDAVEVAENSEGEVEVTDMIGDVFNPISGDYEAIPSWEFNDDIASFAKENKKDGFYVFDSANDENGDYGFAIAVLNSNQIKSATDNAGTFSADTGDIRFSRTARQAVDELMTGAAKKIDRVGNKKREMPKGLTPEQAAAANKFDTFRQRTTLQDKLDSFRSVTGKKIHQKVFDQFTSLRDYSQKAFMQAHLSKGSETTVETIVRSGAPYLKDGAIAVDTSKGGFLDSLKKNLGSPDEANRFFMWVAGNRADALSKEHAVYQDGKEIKILATKAEAEKFAATLDGNTKVKHAGRENLFTQDDIAALKELNSGKTDDGKVRAIAYGEMLKELNRYQKALLDMAEQAGTVNAESRAQWESEFYVPFYRVMEKEDGSVDTRFGMSDTGLMRQEVIKRLKGGTENLGDPLNNLISNWEHIISSTMKNMAANEALTQAEALGAARKIPKSDADGTMWTLQNGQRTYWEVADKDLIESITALDFQGYNNGFMKAAGAFKRVLTMGVTISPSFRIRSATRDILHALAVADVGYNPLKNAIEGWKQTGKDSELMAQMLAGGGAIRFGSFTDGKSGDVTRRMLELDIKENQILDTPEKFKRFFGSGIRNYMELGDRLENNSRVAAYQRAMDKTGDHLIASFEARDIMNFTSMGSSAAVRALAQTLPFFNARLQGMSKLYRGAKNDPRRFWGVVGTIGAASALLYLLNADDDEYKSLPGYVRDTYWPIKVGGKWVYVPKPFEVGSMASVIERFTELAVAGDDYKARDFKDTIFSILVNQLQMNPVPQIILPAAEAWYNYDTFRGREIDSMAMQRLMPGDRYNANTSAGAVALGRAMNISPQKLEHLVSGYFGWLGLQALNVSDLLGRTAMDLPSSTKRDMTQTNNWFIVGDFVKESGTTPSKYTNRFYDVQREINQIYATANAARSSGDIERYNELMSDPKMGARRMFASATNRINLINKQIRSVTADRDLSAAEKNERLKALHERRDKIARDVDDASRR